MYEILKFYCVNKKYCRKVEILLYIYIYSMEHSILENFFRKWKFYCIYSVEHSIPENFFRKWKFYCILIYSVEHSIPILLDKFIYYSNYNLYL